PAGDLGHQGEGASAADRPHHRYLPRGASCLRQGRPGRDGHRSGAALYARNDDHAQSRGRMA
ncbi:MAG: hypothetical protein OET08_04885, partial [Desulfuromonadales bacterium]|nr:hypothetical protein [Desulfuromonadales bacterium]